MNANSNNRTQKEDRNFAEGAEKTFHFWFSFCALCETSAPFAFGCPNPTASR